MKIKSIFTAAVALTLGLTACNKEESLSQDGLPVNAVRITATIGNPFATTRSNPLGTVEEQAKFNRGDEMLVLSSTGDGGLYQFDGTKWLPSFENYPLWVNDSQDFLAVYPVDGDALSYVQKDQSTLPQIAKSDLMFAEIFEATKGDEINFIMQRLTSRIIVNIEKFNAEFLADSKVKDVKIAGQSGVKVNYFTPYSQGEGGIGSSYTLLVDKGMRDTLELYTYLKVDEKEMRSPNLPGMDAGKSYTFNLTVGKEKLEIGSVTVADWTGDVILDEDEAEEVFID